MPQAAGPLWHWLGCVGVKPKPLKGLTGVCSDIFIVLPWRFGHVGCASAAAFSLLGLVGVGHRRRPDCMATGLVWLWLLLAVGVNVSVLRPRLTAGLANRLDGRGLRR